MLINQSILLLYSKVAYPCDKGYATKRNGIYDEVTGILAAAGKSVVEFPGVMANPTCAKVREGAALAREKGVDLILGAGGGSVMDCCKAISMAAVYDGDIWDDFWARPGVVDFRPLLLGVIITRHGQTPGAERLVARRLEKTMCITVQNPPAGLTGPRFSC